MKNFIDDNTLSLSFLLLFSIEYIEKDTFFCRFPLYRSHSELYDKIRSLYEYDCDNERLIKWIQGNYKTVLERYKLIIFNTEDNEFQISLKGRKLLDEFGELIFLFFSEKNKDEQLKNFLGEKLTNAYINSLHKSDCIMMFCGSFPNYTISANGVELLATGFTKMKIYLEERDQNAIIINNINNMNTTNEISNDNSVDKTVIEGDRNKVKIDKNNTKKFIIKIPKWLSWLPFLS